MKELIDSLLIPSKVSPVKKPPIEILSEDEQDDGKKEDEIPKEVSFLWWFLLGDEWFYLILKKMSSVKYDFALENSDSELHIHASLTPTIEEVQLVASRLSLSTGFVTPNFTPLYLKTVIPLTHPVHNIPTIYSRQEDCFNQFSFEEECCSYN